MERSEIFEKVCEICRDVFDDEELEITEATSASDIDGWDSLTHLSIIDEIEQTYEIAFTLDEANGSKNIGELINAIMRHLENK